MHENYFERRDIFARRVTFARGVTFTQRNFCEEGSFLQKNEKKVIKIHTNKKNKNVEKTTYRSRVRVKGKSDSKNTD